MSTGLTVPSFKVLNDVMLVGSAYCREQQEYGRAEQWLSD